MANWLKLPEMLVSTEDGDLIMLRELTPLIFIHLENKLITRLEY